MLSESILLPNLPPLGQQAWLRPRRDLINTPGCALGMVGRDKSWTLVGGRLIFILTLTPWAEDNVCYGCLKDTHADCRPTAFLPSNNLCQDTGVVDDFGLVVTILMDK